VSAFGAGVRRGVMAADRFTQIANGLFRDTRLSFQAKGIFGCISTHRDGWQLTVADLVRVGPDGRNTVRGALGELESHGYLVRDQLRRENGTLGEIVYSITDRPAGTELVGASAVFTTSLADEMTHGAGAGIRRGVMGGDQFTQVANALFRDARISFKAKGIFGGWAVHTGRNRVLFLACQCASVWTASMVGCTSRRGRAMAGAVAARLRMPVGAGSATCPRSPHPGSPSLPCRPGGVPVGREELAARTRASASHQFRQPVEDHIQLPAGEGDEFECQLFLFLVLGHDPDRRGTAFESLGQVGGGQPR
jgi:hypothetical protein